jgi:hypothetical protein
LIVDGELGINNIEISKQTLSSTNYRDRNYKTEESRWNLRKSIINELLENERPLDDDNISLGNGGAKPNCILKSKKQCFIVIGLPASGKSKFSNEIADKYGCMIIDSDYAKRKLPEFSSHLYGATLVHSESSEITFGFNDSSQKLYSLYEECIIRKHNFIMPKIGDNPTKILESATVLKKIGYKINLVLVNVDRIEATKRAIKRYEDSKRYVPLGLIFDGYGNNPLITYFYLRTFHSNIFESFTLIDNNEIPFIGDSLGKKLLNLNKKKLNLSL